MDGFRVAIVAMALTDTDWTRAESRQGQRVLTDEEFDALADWGWHEPGLMGVIPACAKAVRWRWRPHASDSIEPTPLDNRTPAWLALAVGLADVATLAAARDAWQPAVLLFAKAEALLLAEGAAFSLAARDHYERVYARAKEALGGDAQAVAATGQALTLEQALTEAEVVLARDHDGRAGRMSLVDREST